MINEDIILFIIIAQLYFIFHIQIYIYTYYNLFIYRNAISYIINKRDLLRILYKLYIYILYRKGNKNINENYFRLKIGNVEIYRDMNLL